MAETTTFLAMNGKPLQINGWFFNRDYWKKPLTLTLETDGHGTLTADTVTGYAGDTVELTTAYNTYYRFSGYDVTGGTIDGNTFTFGDEDATAYAAFKPNAFTATGNFEKGSNVHCESKSTTVSNANVPAKYAVLLSQTGDIPAEWYAESNRWNPSNASAYTMQLNPKMQFLLRNDAGGAKTYATACSLVGSTVTQTAAYSRTSQGTSTHSYNTSFTTTTQGVNYGVSAKLQAVGAKKAWAYWASADYIATGTTGTWSATGYAP